MSGDCPHRAQLQNTLLEYRQQTEQLASTQSTYLEIIGDLKTELDTLSCQVTDILQNTSEISPATPPPPPPPPTPPPPMQQQPSNPEKTDEKEYRSPSDIPPPSKDFEVTLLGTLSDLEHQNDMLQAALIRATKNRDDYSLELEEKNVFLQSHLDTMRRSLMEKDMLIAQQNVAIARLMVPKNRADDDSFKNVGVQLQDAFTRIEILENELDRSRNAEQVKANESRLLNEQLSQMKSNNGHLLVQIDRLRSLLRDKCESFQNLQNKYEELSTCSESKSREIQQLQQSVSEIQTTFTQNSIETKLLQHQLASLRQKDAITTGELKALQNRYRKLEQELALENELVIKLKTMMQQKEDQYITNMKRQQEVNLELGESVKLSAEKLEKLRKDYDELSLLSAQQAQTIESYNKWKVEQRKADAFTKQSREKYENYVRLLTQQNKNCLERCKSLHENNQILTEEIKRLRASTLSTKPGVFTPMTTSGDFLIVNRLDRLRQTTQRVLQQKLQFENDTSRNGVPSSGLFLSPNIIAPHFMAAAGSVIPNPQNLSETILSTKPVESADIDSNKSSAKKSTL